VALLADAGSYAKPVLVFAPDNEKRANGGDRAPGAAPEQQTAQQAEQ
jgi:tRNA pseudouridine55 synthase